MKKITLISCLFFLTSVYVKPIFAQLPVINSFSPSSGYPGTTVNIYGYNFKLLAAGNSRDDEVSKPPSDYTSVKFGNYSAIIVSGTSTYAKVTVPSIPVGSYKIKVCNANGCTESAANFNVTPPPPPPITNLAYLHGFRGSSTDWQNAHSILNQEFLPNHVTNSSYNSLNNIGYTAAAYGNSLVPYANSVVVAYSMGGVLAREIKRQRGVNCNIKGLISVGSSHTGAPVVNNVNNIYTIANWWLDDLAAGWFAYAYPYDYALWIARYQFLGPILDIIYANVKDRFFDATGVNSAGAQDLKPNSGFMNTLNSNPGNSLPPAIYSIYGEEDWYSHVRLGDAAANGGTEVGNYVQYYYDIISYYAYQAYLAYDEADWNFFLYFDTGDPYYLDQYYYWNYVGGAFNSGAYALNMLHQQDWNTFVVGENLSTQNLIDRNPINDAFIPTYSAAPSFIASEKKLKAIHTNHLELTTKSESINQIRAALKKPDINLPLR